MRCAATPRAAEALVAAADAAAAVPAGAAAHPLPHPAPWLALPLLLYAHASGREELAREGRRLVLRAAAFPELPHVWWDAERPAAGLSAWAGAVVGAAVACQVRPACNMLRISPASRVSKATHP